MENAGKSIISGNKNGRSKKVLRLETNVSECGMKGNEEFSDDPSAKQARNEQMETPKQGTLFEGADGRSDGFAGANSIGIPSS